MKIINKIEKKILPLLFLFILFFVSCETTYDLRNEKVALDQILEDLQSKKVIFIGENHDDVFPIIFCTRNLEAFYNAGLRYIFLESGDDGLLDDSNIDTYDFQVIPPWGLYAWKFEQQLFEEKVIEINKKNPSDIIKVIWPENNLILPNSNNVTEVLNFRDNHIQKKIIEKLTNAKQNEKAIVFYGSGHGSKIPSKYIYANDNEVWKMFGVYLSEYFKEDYSSYLFNYLSPKETKTFIEEYVILSKENFSNFVPNEYKNAYDYVCVANKRVFGVPYSYIRNYKNLKTLHQKSNISCNNKYDTIEKLFAIYYLNYHLYPKNEFYYENNKSKDNRYIDLFSEEKFESNSYSLCELENYMEYLYSYGWLEDYLYNPANDERIDYVLYNMKKAIEINQKDIWPQYWISYFKTEQAIYSDKKRNYKKALREWDKLLDNDLVFFSPVLPLVYKKMALCEEKLGNIENQQLYSNKAKEVSKSLSIDYEQLVYFGY